MKKTISIIAIFLLSIFVLSACDIGSISLGEKPKDADYLYEWLTEHGTLVSGTRLQYFGTNSKGERFSLCYDTNLSEKSRWYVTYETEHILGYKIETKLFLFSEDSKTYAHITTSGIGDYSDYYRSMEYSHKPKSFTKNSPIEQGELSGSTVHVPDSDNELVRQIHDMNTICENNAQKSLCQVLDWLKESFCSTAKMKMSDFGYGSY